MARPSILSESDIKFNLEDLDLWEFNENTISREIVASNFAMAVGIVNSIAIIAESLDHHPDILIYGWNKIRITTTTHDQGGLTNLDFELARKIEKLKI